MFSIAESGIKEKCSSTVDDEKFGAGCVIKTRPAPNFLLPLKAVLANTYIYLYFTTNFLWFLMYMPLGNDVASVPTWCPLRV